MNLRLTAAALAAVWLASASAAAQHEGMPMPSPAAGAEHDHGQPGATPPGLAEVKIAPDRLQLIGMRTANAEVGTLGGAVRASATIQPDETREAHVHSKLMGWVQELFVNSVGQKVEKGQALYSLYSQELFAAEQEYLRARKTGSDLAAVARQRLQLWDVPEDQLRLMETKGPQKAVVFRSPTAGTVIEKAILKGHYLEPDMMLYRIADLTNVWIIANVYEFEVNRIARGDTAQVEVQGIPTVLEARIDYVYPTVDETSRTVKVRLVAPNIGGLLRPGSFATVTLPTRAARAVWVPDAAVIDTGLHQVVYLALPEGRFRPVLVKVGRRVEGKAEILAGLLGGEDVVVSAQFLIDSESRLRGVGTAPGGHQGH
jgi:Cu(I)/Ag(I) efflux system membrane fusion protein